MYRIEEINDIVKKSLAVTEFGDRPQTLYEPLTYMISIGGKRIRPRLCLLAFNLFSDNIDNGIIGPAMALEIFHSFTLIHDDIMDKADTRRGQMTVHKKWNDNCAILSGDVMCIISYRYLAQHKGVKLPAILELFTTTATQVCEGQQYDMDFEEIPFITMQDYEMMIGLKTAVLIACSAKMGALAADAPQEMCDALYDFGYKLGIAFQIADDYLDTFGNPNVFGKKLGGDIANNKKTWLLTECFRLAKEDKRERLNHLLSLGEDAKDEKFEGMKQLYCELGVNDSAIKAIEHYHELAMQSLQGKGFTDEQIAQLKSFSDELVHRNG